MSAMTPKPRARAICALLLGALPACGSAPEALHDGPAVPPTDSAVPFVDRGSDDGDTPPADGPPPANTVEVRSARELRGVWVATVSNIDFPSKQGLSAAAQKAELVKILETLAAARFNAVFFQVRPEGDALYPSSLEPWSRYLTGTQGHDPGYDPLAFLVDEAHARNIEVHAWFNPYRAKASKSSTAVAPHMSLTLADYAYAYGTALWMDPGAQAVIDHTVAVILDVVRRYDVDGVHFDDYFYPYPVAGATFPDDKTYAAYKAGGGALSKADWRRDNVNRLVKRLSQEIAATKPHVRFGISPFGIYRPGTPDGITGLDQYAEIFADPPLWKKEGWVDYLAPQLYWPTTQTAQAYGKLVAWWPQLPDAARYTFVGNYLSKLGSSATWSLDEFRAQIKLTRAQSASNALGNIFFSWVPLRENRQGIVDVFREELYPAPAVTPPLAAQRDVGLAPPAVVINGRAAQITHVAASSIRAWTIHAAVGTSGWKLHAMVPAATNSATLDAGRWAIAALGKNGTESRGVLVEAP
jgi:uncharacterized lipoprotein YddW (UPF0748 family)